jgi:MFS transporter, FSR family, fosmidomycin resistance protein
MRRILLLGLLALAHGVSDGSAGLLLGGLSHSLSAWQVGLLVLVYNALAFGGQPVAGLLVDRLRQPKLAAVAGLVVMGVALLTAAWQPVMAIGLAGVGSALLHVGGGALALCATPERASGPGLFASFGVIGLAIGGALAITDGALSAWPFVVLIFALAGAIGLARPPALPYLEGRDEPLLQGHDVVMLVLLAAIALRSAVWNVVQYAHEGQVSALLALALAAGAGKLLGGLLADWIGWRRWATGALLVAAPLLAFGGQRMEFLLPGVALLQSATPVALSLMARALPRQPATAAGMALGLGIAAGALPALGGFGTALGSPLVFLAAILLATMAMAWAAMAVRRGEIPRVSYSPAVTGEPK